MKFTHPIKYRRWRKAFNAPPLPADAVVTYPAEEAVAVYAEAVRREFDYDRQYRFQIEQQLAVDPAPYKENQS